MWRLSRSIALICLSVAACSNGHAEISQTSKIAAKHESVSKPAVSLSGRVTDEAKILCPGSQAKLSAKLERFENATHHQMVVVTISSLEGRDIADFTRDLSNAWGIGRKDYNDGIVLLVAPNKRKVRIAIGYGLEKELTKSVCQQIIDSVVLPRFRAGDFSGGIEGGSDAIIARLS